MRTFTLISKPDLADINGSSARQHYTVGVHLFLMSLLLQTRFFSIRVTFQTRHKENMINVMFHNVRLLHALGLGFDSLTGRCIFTFYLPRVCLFMILNLVTQKLHFGMVICLDNIQIRFAYQAYWVTVKHWIVLIWVTGHQLNLVLRAKGQGHKLGQGHLKVKLYAFDLLLASGRRAFDRKAFLLF